MICTECLRANLDRANLIIWTGTINTINGDDDSTLTSTPETLNIPVKQLLHFNPLNNRPPLNNDDYYAVGDTESTYTYLGDPISLIPVALVNGEELCEEHAYTALT